MKLYTYRQVRIYRTFVLVLCAALASIAIYKMRYNLLKISYFKKAEQCYASKRLVEAEEWYSKAKSYKYFNYNENILSEQLNELKNITKLKMAIKELKYRTEDEMNAVVLSEIYKNFVELKEEEVKKGEESAKIFDEVVDFFDFKDALDEGFKMAKEKAKENAVGNLKRQNFDQESFKEELLVIPYEYYGGEDNKKNEIQKLIKDYDNAKFDILCKNNDASILINLAEEIICFNKENAFEYKWTIEKVEGSVAAIITDNSKYGDYRLLENTNKKYGAFIKPYLKKSKVLDAINSKIDGEFKKAKELIKQGKYKEAIELYERLAIFKDTEKLIINAKIDWFKNKPDTALALVYPDKSFLAATSIKDMWGSAVCVIGLDDTGDVYFIRVMKDGKYTSAQKNIFRNEQEAKYIRVIENKKPIIVIEVLSNTRKGGHVGLTYDSDNESLNEIFRFEADNFYFDSNGQLIVENPTGDREGKTCYYKADEDGYYRFSYTKEDYTDVLLENIASYKGKPISFSCSITDINYKTGIALGQSQNYYVVLSGKDTWPIGSVIIKGKYLRDVEVTIDENVYTLPEIEVVEVR